MSKFILDRKTEIDFPVGTLYEYHHIETQTPILFIKNQDPNRAFAIQFRTPPESDNGICHILEHSVLSGSKKYDIKEPFVELIKGSLNTFLNAMTFADRTLYPFSTTNAHEFYNMCDVYLDGVFFPNIYRDQRILGQEGWHYELTESGDLTVSGVVYNEMQGEMSQPDNVLFEGLSAAAYDNAYRFNSGGDPKAIPTLTQSEFLDYHQRYYHPSNAVVLVYGDLEIEDVLNKLDSYLGQFEGKEKPATIEKTAAFSQPQNIELRYPVMKKEPGQAILGMSFVQSDYSNLLDNLGLKLLVDILFSMDSSPVKTMLTESGLAHDIYAIFDDNNLQPMMTVVCQGLEQDSADIIKEAVMFELERLASEGLDPEIVLAGLNQWKFYLRTGFQEGSASKGVHIAIDLLANLDRGLDPLERLNYEGLTRIIEEQTSDRFFEKLIEKYFLQNKHRVNALLIPDEKLQEREEKAFQARMAELKSSFSPEELTDIKEFSTALAERQQTPDDPKKLASLPLLKRSDLTDDFESIGLKEMESISEIYTLNTKSKGITDLSLIFALDYTTKDDLKYLGLIGPLLGKLATKQRSANMLSNDLAKYTGGFSVYPRVIEKPEGKQLALQIDCRYLDEYQTECLDLIFEIISATDFSDVARIQNLIRSFKNNFESFMLEQGDAVATERLSSQLKPAGALFTAC